MAPAGAEAEAAGPGDGLDLPEGVLAVRVGPGANCSSAGSAIDVLFYGSVIVGAIAVALAAAFPPRERRDDDDDGEAAPPAAPAADHEST
ncbi:MAG: hypothetical protein QM820_56570 [Minicystis sp.]